eukprot:2188252-Rhodomonas_salina.2
MACPSDELCTCLPVLTVLVFCRMQLTRSLRERECPRQLTAVTPISVSALYFQRARPFAVSLFQPSCTRRTAASLQVLAADLRGVCAGNARNLPMLSAAPHAFPPPTTPWLPFSVALGGLVGWCGGGIARPRLTCTGIARTPELGSEHHDQSSKTVLRHLQLKQTTCCVVVVLEADHHILRLEQRKARHVWPCKTRCCSTPRVPIRFPIQTHCAIWLHPPELSCHPGVTVGGHGRKKGLGNGTGRERRRIGWKRVREKAMEVARWVETEPGRNFEERRAAQAPSASTSPDTLTTHMPTDQHLNRLPQLR